MAIVCSDILSIPLETKGIKNKFDFIVLIMEKLNSIPETYLVHLTSPIVWNPETVQLCGFDSVTNQPFHESFNDDDNNSK